MKIPQTPENWRKMLGKENEKIFKLLNEKGKILYSLEMTR